MEQTELDQLHAHQERLKRAIKKADALNRLVTNKDFKEIILDDYLENEAIRNTHLLAEPTILKDENIRRAVNNNLMGVACFAQYLRTIEVLAERSKDELEQSQQELEQAG